jgi:hypothetical protein
MIKHFKAKALFAQTNRMRTVNIVGRSISDVYRTLKKEGFVEPFTVEELFFSPSEAQLKYAKDLNITVPQSASSDDVSALISKRVDGDSDPNPDLVDYASGKGFVFSNYIGKKTLYNLIFYQLPLEDKIAFFVFSVYRWLSDDRGGNLDKHKHREVFYEFAKKHVSDEKFTNSMLNYSGEDIRFFGTLKWSDGDEHFGGSTSTIAYKTCVDFLRYRLGVQNHISKTITSKTDSSYSKNSKNIQTSTKEASGAASGCITAFVIFVAVCVVIFYVVKSCTSGDETQEKDATEIEQIK